MTQSKADWIWFDNSSPTENVVGCFTHPFFLESAIEKAVLFITAETRYVICLNGEEVGRGPARSWPGQKYANQYDVSALLLPGENLLTVRVWDYGLSTYQTIAAAPGLLFELQAGGQTLAASGSATRAQQDKGHIYNTPKRNTNLGFAEVHDARHSTPHWQRIAAASEKWNAACVVKGPGGIVEDSPLPPFSTEKKHPLRVVARQLVRPGCQQVTINTRSVFFPERKDADSTIFSGFLGAVLNSPKAMTGQVVFPNRTWNGIIGDFRIGDTLYPVDNAHREVEVQLQAGLQLFLLQISGKYDDFFSHLEFHFPENIAFGVSGEADFFCIGPTGRVLEKIDGQSRVFGGLDEYDRMEEHSTIHQKIFDCTSLQELEAVGEKLMYVPKDYVLYEGYQYSVVKSQKVEARLSVRRQDAHLLHGSANPTHFETPQEGCCHQLILDFGDIYVGAIEVSLQAQEGTILDLYGYENYFQGEIDFTVGLNNSLRYICRKGAQRYTFMTRTGCRYLVLTLRAQAAPVDIYNLGIHHATYPASGSGTFRCNDDKLNRIWEMCRQTHLCCMEDTFTDSPTYEQTYWLGDALISAYINAWLYGEYPLLRQCLVVGAGNVRNTPLLNALGPTDWNTSIPMWSMNWLLAIRHYVDVSGDTAVIEELYPTLRALLNTLAGFVTPEGGFLINAWNMLDWAELDISNHGVATGNQALLVACCREGAGFARSLGKHEDAARWQTLQGKLEEYIDQHLWDETQQAFVDGWTPAQGLSSTLSVQSHTLLALYDGIRSEKKARRTAALLLNPPANFVQVGSPFFLFYVYENKAQRNLPAVLDDIRNRWTEMMRYDCTTCWEVFPGFYEVGRTRSYCHSWSASPAYFAGRYMLGITPLEHGFGKISVQPPECDLLWCEGSLPTPHGNVSIYWSRENNTQTCRVVAPQNIEVILPTGWECRLEKLAP